MIPIVPGKWYFTVVCRNCGEPFAFLNALSPEEEITADGLCIPQNPEPLGCPMCEHEALYQPGEMQIRQAQGGGFSD